MIVQNTYKCQKYTIIYRIEIKLYEIIRYNYNKTNFDLYKKTFMLQKNIYIFFLEERFLILSLNLILSLQFSAIVLIIKFVISAIIIVFWIKNTLSLENKENCFAFQKLIFTLVNFEKNLFFVTNYLSACIFYIQKILIKTLQNCWSGLTSIQSIENPILHI